MLARVTCRDSETADACAHAAALRESARAGRRCATRAQAALAASLAILARRRGDASSEGA